jgi:hypothetical protein
MYGAPVREDAMKYGHNRKKYTSNEALCTVADTTPIILKIEEAVRIYNLKKGRGNQTRDRQGSGPQTLATPGGRRQKHRS